MALENMNIEKATERCNQLIKPEHANWIGISNQVAITRVLNELETIEKVLKNKEYFYKKLSEDNEFYVSELEKKDLVINEMAEWITKIDPTIYCDKSKCDDNCKECVIKGFTNKVEREGK